MPWTAADAKKFTRSATTPKKRRQWANAAIKEASKSMDEEEKEILTSILKRDDEKRLVYGVVLVPDVEDKQGDIIPAEVIEAAAHEYLATSRALSKQHKELASAVVVESYIAPCEMTVGDEAVAKGSWVIAVKVAADDLWKRIRSGEYGGFSVAGLAERALLGENANG